jgi:tetratricopeptide (TPR) repeat protein
MIRSASVRVAAALALLSGAGCGGEAPSSSVAAAGRAREIYDRGQFRETRELFHQLITQDGPSAPLLYNLGCAFYREGRLGKAIAAWESARLLAPWDPDLLHNLGVASGKQVDRLPEVERSTIERLLRQAAGALSLDQWTLLLYGLYLLLIAALGVRLFLADARLRDHWATMVFVIGAALLVVLVGFGKAWSEFHRPRAVVSAEEVALFSGPDGSGEKIATLHAGLLLEITGAAGQDRQVRLSTGWQGFLPAASLQPIGLEVWLRGEGR